MVIYSKAFWNHHSHQATHIRHRPISEMVLRQILENRDAIQNQFVLAFILSLLLIPLRSNVKHMNLLNTSVF